MSCEDACHFALKSKNQQKLGFVKMFPICKLFLPTWQNRKSLFCGVSCVLIIGSQYSLNGKYIYCALSVQPCIAGVCIAACRPGESLWLQGGMAYLLHSLRHHRHHHHLTSIKVTPLEIINCKETLPKRHISQVKHQFRTEICWEKAHLWNVY